MNQQCLFNDFVTERGPWLRRFATVLTGDPQAADEIVGDVLSRAAGRWDRIGVLAQPTAGVRSMIVEEYLSHRRRPRTTPCAELLEVLDSGDPAQADREALDGEVARWPRKLRAVLVLHFYADVPETEIAKVLRCSERRVHGKTARVLRRADDLRAAFARLEHLAPVPQLHLA